LLIAAGCARAGRLADVWRSGMDREIFLIGRQARADAARYVPEDKA
jgi:hypothetical protein